MAFDEGLAHRIREILQDQPAVTERKMFGGLAFMVRGNMCCGIVNDDLMARTGPEQHDAALAAPHVRPMDFTGRPSRGMVFVEPAGISEDEALRKWVMQGVAYAATLPPK